MVTDRTKTAIGVSTFSAIAAAIALMKSGPVQAAGTIPEELMNLVIAIAQSTENIDLNSQTALTRLQEIIDAIAAGGAGQGYPANKQGTRTTAVACVIANQAYEAPDLEVPEGMALAIKAFPTNGVGSLVRVARTPAECLNANSSWPLVPNEAITYFVKNANAFWVSSNMAGSIVLFSAEQG